MLDRAAIAARIPHAGAMCLLERVESWDEAALVCRALSHAAPDNPLRDGGRLGAIAAAEYAAQAMAVHGALCAGGAAGGGYLAALRAVKLHAERLDDIAGELRVEVQRLGGDAAGFVYAFAVHGGERLVAEGRATVMNRGGSV